MNLKKWKGIFTSKFVGTGPSSYEKIIYPAAISQRFRNTALRPCCGPWLSVHFPSFLLVFGHCRPIFYSHIVIILFSLISPSFPCSSIVTVTICFGIILLVNLKLYRTKFNVVRRTVLEVINSTGSVSFVIV